MNPRGDEQHAPVDVESCPVPEDPRVVQALDKYLSAVDAGRRPDRDAFLAAHPDITTNLAKCLDSLEFIEQARPRLQESALSPAQIDTSPLSAITEGTLGDYRLLRELGRGGMGIVYEAEQISLCRRVALKVLPFASTLDPKQLQRFKNEAHAAAQIQHPNIVGVFATGCERGVHYYAMQFVEGQTLAELVRGLLHGRETGKTGADSRSVGTPEALTEVPTAPVNVETPVLPPTERSHQDSAYFRTVAQIGIQAAEALEHAHQTGIIHRDIKPGNLLIENAPLPHHPPLPTLPSPVRVWITDFGLAHCKDQVGPTMTGDLVGTLRYMSPEQALAKRVVLDQRTDVYSLGATLYELLTLAPVFPGQDRQELLRQIAFEEPRPPRQLNKSIPAELETIILKALEKNPADRFNTAQELADDLRRFLEDQPIRARRATVWQKTRKWCRRHKPLVWTGLAFSVIFLCTVAALASLAAYSSQRQLKRIQEAEELATRRLYGALVAQARAHRLSRRPGQRFQSLQALGEAVKIARSLDLGEESSRELRNEAFACLMLPDFEVAKEWDGWPLGSRDLAFDPAFERYARSDKDGNVSIRRVVDDHKLLTLPGAGPTANYGLEFSPDGRLLHQRCGVPNGCRSRLWRVDGRKPVALVDDDHDGFTFRLDSQACAAHYPDGSLRIYDTASGKEVEHWRLSLPPRKVRLHWNPRRPLILAGAVRTAWLINTETGAVEEWKLPLTGRLHWADWHPDGRLLAVGVDGEHKIYLWDTITKQLVLPPLEGHKHDGLILRFDHSGERLLSSDWSGTWRLWDVNTGRELLTMLSPGPLLQFSRGDTLVAAESSVPRLRLYRFRSGQEFRTLIPRRGPRLDAGGLRRSAAALDPQGRLLAVSAHDGIALLDVARGEEVGLLPLRENSPLAFLQSGELLTCGSSGLLRWPVQVDPDTGQRRYGPPQCLTVKTSENDQGASADGRVLAIPISNDGALVLHQDDAVWARQGPVQDRQDPRLVRLQPQEDVRHCAVSPDGAWVATGSHSLHAGAGAKVWDARTGDLKAELPAAGLCPVGFSPDGKWLATGGGGVRLWYVGSWRPGPTVSGPSHSYFAFSPDSRLIAVTDDPGIVRLVVCETGAELARLTAPVDCRLRPRCFTPDGRLLVTLGEDQAVHVFDLALIRRQLADLELDCDLAPAEKWNEFRSTRAKFPPLKLDVVLSPEDCLKAGRARAAMGQWAAAAAGFAKAFELEEPKKPLPWFEHAYLRLQLGDQKGYQRICRRLLERLGQSERDWDVDLLAHTCVLAPGALKEASQVVALAEKRLARTGPENRWSLQVVGLAYYRAAKYDKAVEVLAKAVKDHPDFAPNIANWLILSMAHQHLKQPAEARQWLKQAVARIKELQPKDRFAPEGWEWRDWLGVHLLRREAEGLLNAAKDSGKDRK